MITGQQQERRLQWKKRIADYKSSGQSVREWCAANGLDMPGDAAQVGVIANIKVDHFWGGR